MTSLHKDLEGTHFGTHTCMATNTPNIFFPISFSRLDYEITANSTDAEQNNGVGMGLLV